MPYPATLPYTNLNTLSPEKPNWTKRTESTGRMKIEEIL
jgi:hypothetical protein